MCCPSYLINKKTRVGHFSSHLGWIVLNIFLLTFYLWGAERRPGHRWCHRQWALKKQMKSHWIKTHKCISLTAYSEVCLCIKPTSAAQAAKVQGANAGRVARHAVTELKQAVQRPQFHAVVPVLLTAVRIFFRRWWFDLAGWRTSTFSALSRPASASSLIGVVCAVFRVGDLLDGAGVEAGGQLDVTHDCKDSFTLGAPFNVACLKTSVKCI